MTTKKRIAPVTHVGIVLDRSGSMVGLSDMAVTTFNEQVQTLKSVTSNGAQTYLSGSMFNTAITAICESTPIAKAKELPREKYQADGMTALYDATWHMLDTIESGMKASKKNDVALCVIISDGQENSSTQHTSKELADRIRKLERTKRWTFAYAGADFNLSKAAKTVQLMTTATGMTGTHSGSTCFVNTTVGMASFSSSLAYSMTSYINRMAEGQTNVINFFNNT